MTTRIVAIDDDHIVLGLLDVAFGQIEDCELIGLASVDELTHATVRAVDVVLIDTQVPGASTAQLVGLARNRWPAAPIVLVTADIRSASELIAAHCLAGALIKSPALSHLAATALELAGVQRP